MDRIKTLIIERQCDSDDCNVGDRHEFHCLAHQEWDKKALAESRQPLKCPACNSQIHTYTKEVYRNVPYFNKDAKPKTITVKRTCSGSNSSCGFSHKDQMPVLPGDLYEFPTIDWWWRCPKCRADFVPSITERDTIFHNNDNDQKDFSLAKRIYQVFNLKAFSAFILSRSINCL